MQDGDEGINLPVSSIGLVEAKPIEASARTTLQGQLATAAAELPGPEPYDTSENDQWEIDTAVNAEHAEGPTWAQLLARSNEPVELSLRLRVLCDVLRSLQVLHGRVALPPNKRCHGAITPYHVIVCANGAASVARAESGVDVIERIKSLNRYKAPEQREGRSVDQQVDIYACGVLLWDCLCAEVGVGGLSTVSADMGIVSPKLPVWAQPLVAVVERATATKPSARFSSAQEMRLAIENHAESRVAQRSTLADLAKLCNGERDVAEDGDRPTARGLIVAQGIFEAREEDERHSESGVVIHSASPARSLEPAKLAPRRSLAGIGLLSIALATAALSSLVTGDLFTASESEPATTQVVQHSTTVSERRLATDVTQLSAADEPHKAPAQEPALALQASNDAPRAGVKAKAARQDNSQLFPFPTDVTAPASAAAGKAKAAETPPPVSAKPSRVGVSSKTTPRYEPMGI